MPTNFWYWSATNTVTSGTVVTNTASASSWPFGVTGTSATWVWEMSGTAVTTNTYDCNPVYVYAPTEQEQRDLQERLHQAQIAAEQAMEERKDADARAEQLLLDSLNLAQRVMYEQAEKFIVEGNETGTKYEIRHGRSVNIHRLDDSGKTVDRLCAHPVLDVPDGDTMLAQKLMLETCERDFLRIANVHGV